jgi:hypothetical protein
MQTPSPCTSHPHASGPRAPHRLQLSWLPFSRVGSNLSVKPRLYLSAWPPNRPPWKPFQVPSLMLLPARKRPFLGETCTIVVTKWGAPKCRSC